MLEELFRRQHGVISRRQAVVHGATRHAIERRVRLGEWIIVERGVLRHAAVPWTWEAQQMAWALASGGLTSHRAAARLWGIDDGRFGAHELSIRRGRSFRRNHVVVHELTQMDLAEVVSRDGIAVTTVERTILDLGAVLRLGQLEHVADSALRQQLTTWRRLHETLVAHSRRGRDGCGVLRALLEERYGDPAIPLSRWSREVAQWAIESNLPTPVLEFRVVLHNGEFVAQVDLAWPEVRLGLELDSVEFHLNRGSFERDPTVRNRLRGMGWEILECTWNMWIHERIELRRNIWSSYQRRLGSVVA